MLSGRTVALVALARLIASEPAVACNPQHYVFSSGGHLISMDVRCFDPYQGARLAFIDDNDPRKEICLVQRDGRGTCPGRFVGAIATARFTVRRNGGKLRGPTAIREYVTIVEQSPDLPPQPPFAKTQVLIGGVITDVQAFGYDEGGIADGERAAERLRSRERLWRICRQDLYLNDEPVPFATITWRHTLDSIDIVEVQRESQGDRRHARRSREDRAPAETSGASVRAAP